MSKVCWSTAEEESRALRAVLRRRNPSPPLVSVALTIGLVAAPLVAAGLIWLARGGR